MNLPLTCSQPPFRMADSQCQWQESSTLQKMDSPMEYPLNPLARKYEGYPGYMYNTTDHQRRRLSSTGETSGDSSTTTSGSSSYGEREDGSEGRAESEETDREELQHGQVTEEERQAVECFFRGLKTQVFVCSSLANLYARTSTQESEWQLCFTGIPVVLLDVGEARSRDKRRIQIILAERGTCFMLWRDTIDHLTSYKVSGKAFHTMCLSSDHTRLIGISFDMAPAAHEMWSHIERLVACPENISLNSCPAKWLYEFYRQCPKKSKMAQIGVNEEYFELCSA
ncbi:Misexpression suppressor of ras 3 [Carabus blaptoides fortunei]